MKYDFDCVIVGAGISGMTAAIYLKRFNVNILILDYSAPGGILNKINRIENYPGFKSISGPDLAYNVYEQVNNLGIEIRYGKVLEINNHIIKTDLEQISANKIILAIGRKSKKIEKQAKNISYCTVCDGNLYKDKIVGIVGNENSIDDIKFLEPLVKKMYFISTDKLEYVPGNLEYINGKITNLNIKDNLLESIEIKGQKIILDGLFISLGYEPQANFLEQIKKENGYILVNSKMQTNIPYIYACGDIIKKDVYQLTTAVSEATIAAINVKKEI